MEERVIRIIPKNEHGIVAETGRAVLKPPLQKSFANKSGKKRQAHVAFGGDESDGEAESVAGGPGKRTSKPSVDAFASSGSNEVEEPNLLTEGADKLPDKEIQEHLSETFFDFVYGQSYHLLHKPSFMRMLERGTVPPVLMLAVCAISARFSDHPALRESTEPAFLRGEQWAKPARDIAFSHYDRPSMTILTVYLILGLHEFGTCHGGRSWMFGGMAQRMAYAMQLHTDSQHDPHTASEPGDQTLSITDREIRRRTMWSCFLMDRFNSSGSERPIFVGQNYIRTPLPIKESMYFMELAGPTEDLEGTPIIDPKIDPADIIGNARDNMGVAAYLVRLVAIWGNLIEYNNLGGKQRDRHPMWSSASQFYALKTKVAAWIASLPPPLQYSSDNLFTHRSERTANQFLFLHIIYNQILLFMNHFALVPPANSSLAGSLASASHGKDVMPPQFRAEAARIALSAATQISRLAHEAMAHNVVAPFSGYAAFFSSTVHIPLALAKVPEATPQTTPEQVQQLNQAKRRAALSKQCLMYNLRFLARMRKYWGMFAYVSEQVRELYRKCAASTTVDGEGGNTAVFQYGDWYNLYPNGVVSEVARGDKANSNSPANRSGNEIRSPAAKHRPDPIISLGQKSDLQTVEEFFAAENRRPSSSGVPRPGTSGTNSRHKRSISSPSKPSLNRAGTTVPGTAASSISPPVPPLKMARVSSASSVGARDQPRSIPPTSSPRKRLSYHVGTSDQQIEQSRPEATHASTSIDTSQRRPASSGDLHISPQQQDYAQFEGRDSGSLYDTSQQISNNSTQHSYSTHRNPRQNQPLEAVDNGRNVLPSPLSNHSNAFSTPPHDILPSPPTFTRFPSYTNPSPQLSSIPLLPMMTQGLDLPPSMFPPPTGPTQASPTAEYFALQDPSHSITNAPVSMMGATIPTNNLSNTSNLHDFWIDPATAWYTPFNLDPPSSLSAMNSGQYQHQMHQDPSATAPNPSAMPASLISPDGNMGWFDGVSGMEMGSVIQGTGMMMMPELNLDGFGWGSVQQAWHEDQGMMGMQEMGATFASSDGDGGASGAGGSDGPTLG
jgi:hypothetical protein